ncbi:MAG TPA: GNAT family N-acetyltransferase [Clostridia bacterium]|nr:GNAT family N-acetyltransferase [Clostridia bacterium]
MEEFILKDGMENMDFDRVTEMLSKSYWSPGISWAEVVKSAENSALVIGAFLNDGTQIAYARAISDKTRFAYICDVYVDENYRKLGIGQNMVRRMMAHEDMKDVYQWLLKTKDAHGVYGKVGFKPVSRPLDWLEIRENRPR